MNTSQTATLLNTPYTRQENLNANLGLFAQDKWTLQRLTLTYGARYDYFNASTPPADGGRPAVSCRRPRRRRARTSRRRAACRAGTTGRSAAARRTTCSAPARPRSRSRSASSSASRRSASLRRTNPLGGQTDTRAWTDADRNGTIFDAGGNVQFNELGVTANNNFGIPGLGTTQFDPGLPRPTNWEESVSVQHALFPRVSVTAGYYHRTFQHIQYTKNTLLDPIADYQAYTIVAAVQSQPAGRRRRVDHGVQPEPGQARHREQRADVLGRQLARLQRRRGERERAARPRRVHFRRHHHRADGDQQLRRSGELESEQPPLLRSDAAVPGALQGVDRLHACRGTFS